MGENRAYIGELKGLDKENNPNLGITNLRLIHNQIIQNWKAQIKEWGF